MHDASAQALSANKVGDKADKDGIDRLVATLVQGRRALSHVAYRLVSHATV